MFDINLHYHIVLSSLEFILNVTVNIFIKKGEEY